MSMASSDQKGRLSIMQQTSGKESELAAGVKPNQSIVPETEWQNSKLLSEQTMPESAGMAEHNPSVDTKSERIIEGGSKEEVLVSTPISSDQNINGNKTNRCSLLGTKAEKDIAQGEHFKQSDSQLRSSPQQLAQTGLDDIKGKPPVDINMRGGEGDCKHMCLVSTPSSLDEPGQGIKGKSGLSSLIGASIEGLTQGITCNKTIATLVSNPAPSGEQGKVRTADCDPISDTKRGTEAEHSGRDRASISDAVPREEPAEKRFHCQEVAAPHPETCGGGAVGGELPKRKYHYSTCSSEASDITCNQGKEGSGGKACGCRGCSEDACEKRASQVVKGVHAKLRRKLKEAILE